MKLDKTLRGGFDGPKTSLKDLPTLRMQAHELLPSALAATVLDLPKSAAIVKWPAEPGRQPVQAVIVPRRRWPSAPAPVDAVIIPKRLTHRRLAAIAAGLSWIFSVFALYCLFAPAPQPPQAPAQPRAAAKLPLAKTPAAQPMAAPSQPVPPAALPSTPLDAARAFSLGDDARALEHYRALAQSYPGQPTYSVMVGVLSARARER